MLRDGRTDIMLMYMESVGRPDHLTAVAARAADLGKPLIVAKPGRSEAARRAAQSHTASLAGEARNVEAVFRDHGIVRGDDFHQMLGAPPPFTHRPLPHGPPPPA